MSVPRFSLLRSLFFCLFIETVTDESGTFACLDLVRCIAITKEDLEFSVGSKASVWEVKDPLLPVSDDFAAWSSFSQARKATAETPTSAQFKHSPTLITPKTILNQLSAVQVAPSSEESLGINIMET